MTRIAKSALFLGLLAAACGPAQTDSSGPRVALDRQRLVERAADEQAVPRALLLSIGWIDSRLSMHLGSPAADGSCGLFPFLDTAAGSPRARLSLSRASSLTGIPRDSICTDLFSNARAAAAVLRAEMNALEAEYPDLRAEQLGDWYQAVMRLSGNNDGLIADGYAAQVYRVLRDGLDASAPGGAEIHIDAQAFSLAGRALRGDLNADLSGDYCPNGACVAFVPASSSDFEAGREGSAVAYIVIHDMEGSLASAVARFEDPTSEVSAHYCLQSSDGAITQMVRDVDTAWHTGNHLYNIAGVGIEHEGFAAEGSTWYTEAMYQSSAALTRWLSDTLSIPRDRNHIIGHYEVPDAANPGWYGGANHHHDPCDTWAGDPTWHNNTACYWDWDHYMALVNGQSPGAGNGTLTGFVGDACCGIAAGARKPLVGAAITLSGSSLTALTDSNGTYNFSIAPGTYTPTASLDGYISGDHSSLGSGYPAALTVTAGQTSWGSILLQNKTPVQSAPTVSISTPADNSVVTNSPVTVSGMIDDTSITSATIGSQTIPVSAGAFSAPVALAAGANVITVSATNAQGTGSATVQVTYSEPSTGVGGTVRGTSAAPVAGAAVTLDPGGVTSVTSSNGSYSFHVTPGSYSISVDAAGYQPFSGVAVVPPGAPLQLDLQLTASTSPVTPQVRIDAPTEGQSFNVPLVTVSGVAQMTDLASVAVGSEAVSFDANGIFSAQVALQAGSNTLTVTATNHSGTQVSSSVTVTYAAAGTTGSGGCSETGSEACYLLIPALAFALRRRAVRVQP